MPHACRSRGLSAYKKRRFYDLEDDLVCFEQ